MSERARRTAAAVVGSVSPRGVVRAVFFTYFMYACVRLFAFARWARGEGSYVPRPEAPAGILPIGHFTSFFAWVRGGGWDTLLPAGLVIILGAIGLSLVFKRGFCGWICPVGSVWEASAAFGRRLLGRNLRPPRWLDLLGRGVKFALAVAFVWWLTRVPVAEAAAFRRVPYMWVADLKILGIMIEPGYLMIVALVAVVSMLLGPVWCRYLCPLGGMYGALGAASVCTVVRDDASCTHCGRCNRACHASVDVEHARSVRDPECDGCMDCVRTCPARGTLSPRAFGRIAFPWKAWPLLVVGVWLAVFGLASATGNWRSSIPDEAFRQVITSGLLEQRTPGF